MRELPTYYNKNPEHTIMLRIFIMYFPVIPASASKLGTKASRRL
jgi:hypothetical protein